ncbi:MAG: hypothetical protein ABI377_09500, partial [Devosia sp.]
GLFLIQYQSADDDISPPKVLVSSAPGHENRVELVLHPDADQSVLWQPGTSLIARITAPARLHVTVTPQRPNGSRAASVKVESVTQGSPPQPHRSAPSREGVSGDLQLLGHVAGMGDVVVGSNEWIAGPTTPARIEGVSLAWNDKPDDVDLRYAVKSPDHAGAPKLVSLQTFAGTRQRALPIIGLVLELSGYGASHYQFVVEALFLSSPTLRAVGQKVVLGGPTGREPLVGLRVEIQRTDLFEEVTSLPAPAAVSPKPRSASRVRVFRSKPKQDAPSE